MKTLGHKIRDLRKSLGLTQGQLAQKIGLTDHSFMSKIENDKGSLNSRQLFVLAEIFGISIDSLLSPSGEDGEPFPAQQAARSKGFSLSIDELDVRANGDDSLLHEGMAEEKITARWQIPTNILKAQTTAPSESLKIITVFGDSMAPDFLPGERVLVDTGDRSPSPPGVFVLWDGFGLVIKRIELLPADGNAPRTVRLIPRNREYSIYEQPLTDVAINGRVIGKWLWT